MRRRASPNQRGFVLVATIWVLAAMVLFMGFIAWWSAQVQESALGAGELLESRLDRQATLATLVYLGATQHMTYRGLTTSGRPTFEMSDEFNPFSGDAFAVVGNEISVDGWAYAGLGKARFSLQDAGSLVGLRVEISSQRLEALLEHYGISRDRRVPLIAALIDYIDRDDLERLDGIERRGYERLGLQPPTNRFLVSPVQLANVRGWREALGDSFDAFLREVTVHTGNSHNFNTLTRVGMLTLGDFEPAAVDRILEHRRQEYFKSLSQVNEIAGVVIPTDELSYASIPDPYLRVTLWDVSGRQEEWIGIRFTPSSGFGPWEIDYRIDRVRRPTPSLSETHSHPDDPVAATTPPSALFR